MGIHIQEIDQNDYQLLAADWEADLPLWLQPKLVTSYLDKLILGVYRGNKLVGLWVVPMTTGDGRRMARRKYRYLPYASPYLIEQDNLKRREVVYEVFKYLTGKCDEINLPFDSDFVDFAPIQGLGGFVEWRHTHLLRHPFTDQKKSSRLRNHITYAEKLVQLSMSTTAEEFNFTAAIRGPRDEQTTRKDSATNLLDHNQAVIFTATRKTGVCGQIFIAFDAHKSYLMHSWKADDAPRGTLSALIASSVNWVFTQKHLPIYDFEGSVLQSVDYYYSGFNCEITPYGQLLWSRDKANFNSLIEHAVNIPGRLLQKDQIS